jgi:hypothetical protein
VSAAFNGHNAFWLDRDIILPFSNIYRLNGGVQVNELIVHFTYTTKETKRKVERKVKKQRTNIY